MRIVGGDLRGRKLHAPDGKDLRPTSDRARESVFNILSHGQPAVDLDGVSVSAGSACSSGKVAISHVLEAMTPDLPETENAIRVSLGWTTEDADIDRFVEAWSALYGRLGAAEPKKLGRQV